MAALLPVLVAPQARPFTPQLPGGSNHFFYKVDPSLDPVFCRETFGILANYHRHIDAHVTVRQTVKQQLAAMYDNGQRGMRVPVLHSHAAFPGFTQLDSVDGELNKLQKNNLLQFIADVGDAGFQELIVGFFPQEANKPETWGATWNEALFQENWSLIASLHDDVLSTARDHGILQVRFDLLNEGAPLNEQMSGVLDDYLRKLWQNYNAKFGKKDTVGFSMIGWQPERYRNMRDIYLSSGYGLPLLYEVHFYDDFQAGFTALDAAMSAAGDDTAWVIGETYYDDASVAADIAEISTERVIWQIYQWGVRPDSYCAELPIEYRYN
jgi:hypothetical protein